MVIHQKPNHASLQGPERLLNVVSCLAASCPWTISVTPQQMLGALKSEIEELQKEMIKIDVVQKPGNALDSFCDKKTALISEMGDVLFDVLMLEMTIRR